MSKKKKRHHIFYYSIIANRYWHESSPPQGKLFNFQELTLKKGTTHKPSDFDIIILIMYDSYKQLTATAIVAFMLIMKRNL